MSVAAAVGHLQGISFDEEFSIFIAEKRIKCEDFDKLKDFVTNWGAYEFDDLRELTLEDLTEKDTGLKPAQQKRFIRSLKEHFEPESSEKQKQPTPYYRYGQAEIVDSIVNPSVVISIRYIFCEKLFIKEAKERVVINLLLNESSIKDLIDRIRSKEGIKEDRVLELFTHEGYPMNVNCYNEDCPLIKWGFQDSSLCYVFVRRKKQNITMTITQESVKLNTTAGTHTVQILSLLYGNFTVIADRRSETGKTIKQKIYGTKGLHPGSFKLFLRPNNANYDSICIDSWDNSKMQQLFHDLEKVSHNNCSIKLTLITNRLYTCRSGLHYSFGKCTYTPVEEQTDKGYSKFYSILYYMVQCWPNENKSKLVQFMHNEYNLPPLTYSLEVLFSLKSLEQFPLWVALIESLLQLFAAILNEGFQVPANQVFECSDYIWGMIYKQSEKVTPSLQWSEVSLRCKLSHLMMVEAVSLPRCSDVFEKSVIEQKINCGEAVPNCDAQRLTLEKISKSKEIERLLMLSDFHNMDSFITWDVTSNFQSSIPPLELPTDVNWEYICSRDHFQVTDPLTPDNFAFYEGNLVFTVKIIKDDGLQREIYHPLYDPNGTSGTMIIPRSKCNMKSAEDIDLKKFVKPSIRGAFTSAVLQYLGLECSSQPVPIIRKKPSEAIVVILDCSSSMKENIFDDSTKEGEHLDRLTAAKQLLTSFRNRTEGFNYHHVVALVSCSRNPKVELELTDNYEMFETYLKSINLSRGTALYDSIIKGCELLKPIQEKFPECKRRILCLTDGEDWRSKCSAEKCLKTLRSQDIVLDSVLIIGEQGNINQKALSQATGGFCFHPSCLKDALKIFETETILSSAVRQIRQDPLQETLSAYKDLKKYPYTPTDFYGQKDLRTQFAFDLSKSSFSNPARIVQHTTLFGQQERSITSRTQRIMREIQIYLRDPHPEIDIYPQEENTGRWKIVLMGPPHTPYAGGTFILYAKFPDEYPDKPPEIRFETPIYHCNINSNGRICHSILDTKYVPSITIKTLLTHVYGLLMSPEPSDPLDSVLALELNTNRTEYEERARQLVEKFAKKTDRQGIRREIISDEGDAPSSLICPLTGKLFVDPVTTEHGRTYERKALMDYMKSNNNMDPLVKRPISMDRIAPNLNLKELANVFRERSK